LIPVERRTWGLLLLGAGAAVTAAGAYAYARSRRKQSGAGGGLGRTGKLPSPVGRFTDDGYVMTAYRKQDLPIEERVAILQDLLHRDMQGPHLAKIRKLAMDITRGCEARDTACESRAIYDWMRANIRYTGDVAPHRLGRDGPVEGIDLFQSPWRTLFDFQAGDCDDFAGADCALATSVGIPCRWVITSPTADKKKDDYSHILPEHGIPAAKPRRYVAADSTLPGGDHYGKIAPHQKALRFVA
jgi:transglutaminase-like putative cysteine protease